MRTGWGMLGVCYAVFLVYGSLVPFDYTPLSLVEAWEQFRYMPWLEFYSRAAWLAHSVSFVPLAFLWAGAYSRRAHDWFVGVLVLCACIWGAAALEYLRVFFPTRTVAQNNVYAEVLGALAGVLVWWGVDARCRRFEQRLTYDLPMALRAFAVFYGLCYLAVILFPYGFVFSVAELRLVLVHRPAVLELAGAYCTAPMRCGTHLLFETLAIAPLGAAWALARAPRRRWGALRLCGLGLVAGAVIQGVQFLTYTGHLTILSLVSCGVGCALGGVLALRERDILAYQLPRRVPDLARFLLWPYLLVLLLVQYWSLTAPLTVRAVLASLYHQRVIPLDVTHASPELFPFEALLWQTLLYLPLGSLYWLAGVGQAQAQRWWRAGLLSVASTALIGLGHLFFRSPVEPLPVLIAGVAAGAGYGLVGILTRSRALRVVAQPGDPVLRRTRATTLRQKRRILSWQRVMALGLGTAVLLGLWPYPGHAWPLMLGLMAYTLVLLSYPWFWLILLPAGLALVGDEVRSAWFALSPLDALLLTTLAAQLWRGRYRLPRREMGTGRLLVLLTLGVVLSSLLISADDMHHGWSLFTAWMVPWLLYPALYTRYRRSPQRTWQRLAWGTEAGILGAALAVWWERLLWPEVPRGAVLVDASLLLILPWVGGALLRAEWRGRLPALGTLLVAGVTFFGSAFSVVDLWQPKAWTAHILAWQQIDHLTQLMGVGLGRMTALQQALLADADRTGRVQYVAGAGNTFLRLSGGTPSTLEQRIALDLPTRTRLMLDVRTTSPGARLIVSICARYRQHLGACNTQEIPLEATGTWQRYNLVWPIDTLGQARFAWPHTPPLVFRLVTPSPGEALEVDDVHLLDHSGQELLRNGNFQRLNSSWSSPPLEAVAWRLDNLWLYLLYERGGLGLSVFALLLLYLSLRLLASARRGNPYALLLAASLLVLLGLSARANLFDTPHVVMSISVLTMLTLVATSRGRAFW